MKTSSNILKVLESAPSRQTDTPKNRLLNTINEVEEVIYKRTGKLIYELDKQLDDNCRDAIDSGNYAEMEKAIMALKALPKKYTKKKR